MSQFGSRARKAFDRAFPERQIIYRRCGGVRGLRLSPVKQALLAVCALGVAGWCAYATAATLLEGPRPAVVVAFEQERANYERWLYSLRGQATAAHDVLDETSRQFDRVADNLETRHEILRGLLEYARGARLNPERGGANALLLTSAGGETIAQLAAAPAPQRAEPVSLRSGESEQWREAFAGSLGPPSAVAAPPAPTADGPQDFVASLSDPALAERVARTAERVMAASTIY
jgi:hypothetical protein